MAPIRHQKQRTNSVSSDSTYDGHSDRRGLPIAGYYNRDGRAIRRSRRVLLDGDTSSPSLSPSPGAAGPAAAQTTTATLPLPASNAVVLGGTRALRASRGIRHGMVANQEGNQFVLDWVRQNYKYEPNHNVPRSGMYEDYLAACMHSDVQPVNSATFGKLIRHVLPGISTRRLGTRGQSKYHYCGIRRRTSPLDGGSSPTATCEATTIPPPSFQSGAGSLAAAGAPRSRHALISTSGSTFSRPTTPTPLGPVDWQTLPFEPSSAPSHGYGYSNGMPLPPQPSSCYFYGVQKSAFYPDVRLPSFTSFCGGVFQDDQDTLALAHRYEQHCSEILKLLRAGTVVNIPNCIVMFYHNLPDHVRDLIVSQPRVLEAIWCWDCSLYDTIFLTLLPEVYSPISYDTYKDLRLLTQNLQQAIQSGMGNEYPEYLIQQKCAAAALFITKVRRHLNLNQMAQAASAILNYPNSFGLMLKDWGNIDFNSILDQALWVCECDRREVQAILLSGIPHLLRTCAGLERWIEWMQKIVDKYMNGALRKNKGKGYCIFYARQFVAKWGYYTNLVMKELTYSNAVSSDPFSTLHYFLDELIQYHVERFLAKTNWADAQPPSSSAFEATQTQDLFSDTSSTLANHPVQRPNTPKSMQQEAKKQ